MTNPRFIFVSFSKGVLRRCFQCRSRGELGSCKDAFKFNATQIENEPGITAVPCASGWCGKVIESEGTLRNDGKNLKSFRLRSHAILIAGISFKITTWPRSGCASSAGRPTRRTDARTPSTITKRFTCASAKGTYATAATAFTSQYLLFL